MVEGRSNIPIAKNSTYEVLIHDWDITLSIYIKMIAGCNNQVATGR